MDGGRRFLGQQKRSEGKRRKSAHTPMGLLKPR